MKKILKTQSRFNRFEHLCITTIGQAELWSWRTWRSSEVQYAEEQLQLQNRFSKHQDRHQAVVILIYNYNSPRNGVSCFPLQYLK